MNLVKDQCGGDQSCSLLIVAIEQRKIFFTEGTLSDLLALPILDVTSFVHFIVCRHLLVVQLYQHKRIWEKLNSDLGLIDKYFIWEVFNSG